MKFSIRDFFIFCAVIKHYEKNKRLCFTDLKRIGYEPKTKSKFLKHFVL